MCENIKGKCIQEVERRMGGLLLSVSHYLLFSPLVVGKKEGVWVLKPQQTIDITHYTQSTHSTSYLV